MHPGNAPPHEPMPYRPHPGPVIYGEPPPPPHMYYHPPPPGSQYDGSGAAGTMYASRSTRNRPNKESKLHKEGFPSMVPRAQPRTRFQKHEDETLKELKEHPDNLSWKQIAEFFPGRNPGTLQVRFCTKLKKKEKIDWDPEKVYIYYSCWVNRRYADLNNRIRSSKMKRRGQTRANGSLLPRAWAMTSHPRSVGQDSWTTIKRWRMKTWTKKLSRMMIPSIPRKAPQIRRAFGMRISRLKSRGACNRLVSRTMDGHPCDAQHTTRDPTLGTIRPSSFSSCTKMLSQLLTTDYPDIFSSANPLHNTTYNTKQFRYLLSSLIGRPICTTISVLRSPFDALWAA